MNIPPCDLDMWHIRKTLNYLQGHTSVHYISCMHAYCCHETLIVMSDTTVQLTVYLNISTGKSEDQLSD